MKIFGLLKKRQRFGLTLALFVLVFAAASIVKIQAAGNVTGWLWGGGAEDENPAEEPWDGTNTNLGWISMSSKNCDSDENGQSDGIVAGCPPAGTAMEGYGVNIPASGGKVEGYAWIGDEISSGSIGWLDFNPQDHCVKDTNGILEDPGSGKYEAADCTPPNPAGGSAGVFRSRNALTGWARIVGIARESVIGNSGGWSGWVHMDGNYGVDLLKMTGDTRLNKPLSEMTFASAGADELGWIDFSRAKYTTPPPPPTCVTGRKTCLGVPVTICDKDADCLNSTSCTVTDATHWTCSNGTETSAPCQAIVNVPDVGECGTLDGNSACNLGSINDHPMLCNNGTPVPDSSSIDTSGYEFSWTCGGTNACAGSSKVSCSARGKKSCGWIETNP